METAFSEMERDSKKRRRDDDDEEKTDWDVCMKKQEHVGVGFEDSDIFKVSDPFRPFGVFDFPWLKDNLVLESEDWKFDDVFSASLGDVSVSVGGGVDFGGQCLCQTPALVEILPGDTLDEESWPCEGGMNDIDGGDCIWSSVLSQPLSTGFSKVPNA
ncbi:PREDICTED: uncharacterized protein LOC109113865 isoform X1 [Nelumbo nucifera]|uniref:Uncharacterized protein LOC109113865 isoform X1 n=3 Tax=Nelumbo nucifera TaxID=4432 RepID=A0A1U7ZIU2_NELNU|nr:PREDICTED: uncharacterized protein LOC109113865 isoform X1 [Nelumbo nucifera]DAD23799.1 TPA_asm: hypothetical protein HUJ06_025262 [Nelumbo nucifera]